MEAYSGSIPVEDLRFYEAFEAWEAAADALHARLSRAAESGFFDGDRLDREMAESAKLYDAWSGLIEDVAPNRAASGAPAPASA